MKKKCISTATLSVLLLVLFLPVFYYIVFYGTNVNYNEMHKIITVEGNKVLSLCAVIGVAVLGAAYYFLRKSCEYKNIQMHCILRWLGLRHGGQFRPLAL